MTAKEIAKVAYNALDDKKGEDIKIIDIADISVMADYFIITGGSNKNQVQALYDNVMEKLGELEINPRHVEGYNTANWILLDYGDVIIHIFNQEDRLFYDLERIWKDGKNVTVEELKAVKSE
jgi:ribosome-associated protein